MKTYEEMTKVFNNVSKNRCLCPKCGHSIIFDKPKKVICKWCNTYVFKDSKTEFEYRLKESINRKK